VLPREIHDAGEVPVGAGAAKSAKDFQPLRSHFRMRNLVENAVISVWSRVRIKHAVGPAAAQFFQREVSPSMHKERFDYRLGSPAKANCFSISSRHGSCRSGNYASASRPHGFAAQLSGLIEVTRESGQELTQARIVYRLEFGPRPFFLVVFGRIFSSRDCSATFTVSHAAESPFAHFGQAAPQSQNGPNVVSSYRQSRRQFPKMIPFPKRSQSDADIF
jgi:hypothetical protein